MVPAGAEDRVENALLMGAPVRAWMPAANVERIRVIPGVDVVSPQVYLATLRGATCCTLPEMFLIAYDPQTDFTVRPWLVQHGIDRLPMGDAVGGAFVYLPQGDEDIKLYGYGVNLRGNLEQTGAGLDATMFITMETAREIALDLAHQSRGAAHHPGRQHFRRAASGWRPAPTPPRFRPASGARCVA